MDNDFHANLDALVTRRKEYVSARERERLDDLFQQNEEMFVLLYNLINDSAFELKSLIRLTSNDKVFPQTEPTYSQFQSAPTSPAATPSRVLVPETPPAKSAANAVMEFALRTESIEKTANTLPFNCSSKPTSGTKRNTEKGDVAVKLPNIPKRKSSKKAKANGSDDVGSDKDDIRSSDSLLDVDVEMGSANIGSNENVPDCVLPSSQDSNDMTQPPIPVVTKRKSKRTPREPQSTPEKITAPSAPTLPPRKESFPSSGARTLPLQKQQQTVTSNTPTVTSIPIVPEIEKALTAPERRKTRCEEDNDELRTTSKEQSRDNTQSPLPIHKTSPKIVEILPQRSNAKTDGDSHKSPGKAVFITDQSPRRGVVDASKSPEQMIKKNHVNDDNSTSTKSGSLRGSSIRNTFGSSSSKKVRKRRKRKRPRLSLEELEPEPLLETCKDEDEDDFMPDPRPRKTPPKQVGPTTNKSPRKTVQTAVKFKPGPSPTGLRFEGFRTPEAVDRAVRRKAAQRRRLEEGIAAKETVLGHARKALQGYDCHECAELLDYEAAGDPIRKQQLLKHCKHRAKKPPPSTPENYWKLTFDETQTQAPGTQRENGKLELNLRTTTD